jgi:hypothetical protein
MEILFFFLLVLFGVWFMSSGSGSKEEYKPQYDKKTTYYRHVNGKIYKYVGAVENDFIVESFSGNKQIVDADFFNKCFEITEMEFIAVSNFEKQKKPMTPATAPAITASPATQITPQQQQPMFQNPIQQRPIYYPPQPVYQNPNTNQGGIYGP